jgi:hypothetical protein
LIQAKHIRESLQLVPRKSFQGGNTHEKQSPKPGKIRDAVWELLDSRGRQIKLLQSIHLLNVNILQLSTSMQGQPLQVRCANK